MFKNLIKFLNLPYIRTVPAAGLFIIGFFLFLKIFIYLKKLEKINSSCFIDESNTKLNNM